LKNFYYSVISILCFSNHAFSQESATIQPKYTANNKGKFFVSWGGNNESFSKPVITFTGANYNFTIHDVEAQDKSKGWH
jgi:hypothetical protein